MKSAVIVLALCFVAIAYEDLKADQEQFETYITNFNKNYKDVVEYKLRFENFRQSLQRIEKLQKSASLAKFGLNKFSDMSREEFSSRILNKKTPTDVLAQSCLANGVTAPKMDATALPTSFDWRTKGVVTPVKDQGQCGSCWAFSTIGAIESQWALKGNNLTEFSEQLLVDCSTGCSMEEGQSVCNQGCNGGWQWNAYEDVMTWGGVETEQEYPYTAVDGNCALNKKLLTASIKNYTCLSSPSSGGANEDQMAAYLFANGPIAIALDAGLLEDYSSGIIDPWFSSECDPTQLDHALLIVGFDVQSGTFENTPYWIVKNSWGADWGENGYFRIARGYNVCGLTGAVSAVIM